MPHRWRCGRAGTAECLVCSPSSAVRAAVSASMCRPCVCCHHLPQSGRRYTQPLPVGLRAIPLSILRVLATDWPHRRLMADDLHQYDAMPLVLALVATVSADPARSCRALRAARCPASSTKRWVVAAQPRPISKIATSPIQAIVNTAMCTRMRNCRGNRTGWCIRQAFRRLGHPR